MSLSPPTLVSSRPDQPTITVDSTTDTSITISWSVSRDSMVTSAEVTWKEEGGSTTRTVRADGSGTSGPITEPPYTIMDLKSGTSYFITVTVTNVVGSSSTNVTRPTAEGEYLCLLWYCI